MMPILKMCRSADAMISKIIALMCVLIIAVVFKANSQPKPDSAQIRYFAEIKKFSDPFVDNLRRNYVQTYSLPEQTFITKVDSARALLAAVLNKYAALLKPAFVKEQHEQIDYYFDRLFADYAGNFTAYTGKPMPGEALIAARLRKHLVDLNNPALLNNVMFRSYVRSFFAYKLLAELDNPRYRGQDNQSLLAVFNVIKRLITNSKCRNFWQYDYLYDGITNNGIKNIGKIYLAFKKTCRDTLYLHRVNSLYKYEFKRRQGHIIKTYKTAGPYHLDIHLFLPDSTAKAIKRPVMVFFHAGDWKEGKADWYFDDCSAYARKGWVACAVEYRTWSREGALPFDAVKDARSSIRWLRQHATDYNIDTAKVVANGYDAGGQLALACAMADKYNETTDDLRFSASPNLVMSTSGIYDLTEDNNAWVRRYLKDKNTLKDISPLYLVRKGLPPTLLIHGKKDADERYAIARHFATEMHDAGNHISFHPIDDGTHLLWLDTKTGGEVEKVQQDFLRKWGYE